MQVKNAKIVINGKTLDWTAMNVTLPASGADMPPVPLDVAALLKPMTVTMTIIEVDGYPVADQEEGAGALFDSLRRVLGASEGEPG